MPQKAHKLFYFIITMYNENSLSCNWDSEPQMFFLFVTEKNWHIGTGN